MATMGVLTIWHRKEPIATCVSETVDVKHSLSQERTQNFSLVEGCLAMRLYVIYVWFKGCAVKVMIKTKKKTKKKKKNVFQLLVCT